MLGIAIVEGLLKYLGRGYVPGTPAVPTVRCKKFFVTRLRGFAKGSSST